MDNVFIALGSNLDRPVMQLRQALTRLATLPQSQFVKTSEFYRNRPIGTVVQPDFVNAVAWIKSALPPLTLLDTLQEIERSQGRKQGSPRWGPRPLDLDILLFGNKIIANSRLTVPHIEMVKRDFVMIPLAEIAPPGLVIPGLGLVEARVAVFDATALVKHHDG